jgi:transcriptional regulator with XRE-family HTH domain
MTPEQFKETRDRLGLTQGQLAYKIGLSERAVRYYEQGGRAIPAPVSMLLQGFLKAAERA